MEKLSRALSMHPEWVQPKTFDRTFELRLGDMVFAKLVFQKMTGSLAVASTEDETWTFKRVGFLNPRVTVREEGSELDQATYIPKWTGSSGTLTTAEGKVYHWRQANFWGTRLEWITMAGQVLVTFRSGVENSRLADAFKTQATLEFSPEAHSNPELSLLILLGWYLMILHHDDAAAAVAAS